MIENQQTYAATMIGEDVPAWKRLEMVMSQMIRMRLFREDQENYEKLKKMYE
jgi:hypothetical protein